ncbi:MULTISPECIES: hypothetical protein [unclassified Agreia]|jgi:putative transposase|uniref:hypothetical protein n=1 Tax=unclassified Agreia TaxID=2641148 RepID=UPI0012E11E27|nr:MULTISPECIES: hypothetical protein [unclassified Agreia]
MNGDELWRILRLPIEDQIPLAVLIRDSGVELRTLQRWHQLYRDGGGTARDSHPRTDTGTRPTAAENVTFIEGLELTGPRPALAKLRRLAVDEAERSGCSAPSCATAGQNVRALDPALVILALEGPTSYRNKHELVFRRRAERPNQTWQANQTELDVLITRVGGKPDRPWLTIVMDDYSSAICLYTVFTGAPSAIDMALALRQAIWRRLITPDSDPVDVHQTF